MLSVAHKPIIPSFIMLSGVMLNVVMLNVVAPFTRKLVGENLKKLFWAEFSALSLAVFVMSATASYK